MGESVVGCKQARMDGVGGSIELDAVRKDGVIPLHMAQRYSVTMSKSYALFSVVCSMA
jgi:hypothetical protein